MESVKSELLLALDLGTTNVKALVVEAATLGVVNEGSAPADIRFPRPGWAEQDGNQIWGATLEAIRQALDGVNPKDIVGISISNQREAVVLWDKTTGQPIGPVLGWQDSRTTNTCDALKNAGWAEPVQKKTGLPLDAMFSGPKIRELYLAAVADGHDPKNLAAGTIDAWIVFKLTGEALTEVGNASRTLLLDIHQGAFCNELLDIFEVPAGLLPEVRSSDAGFGCTKTGGDLEDILPAGIPILSVLADSHSALYLHSNGKVGEGKATYGTGSSVMVPTQQINDATSGIATTIAWVENERTVYAFEGNILATGAAMAWMAKIIAGGDVRELDRLAETVVASPDAYPCVQFVPAFGGLGAPYFDRDATGLLQGLTLGATREHLAYSVIESVGQLVTDVIEAIDQLGSGVLQTLHADGGASRSKVLMQMQANLLGRQVHVSHNAEASALGAALMASRKIGHNPLLTSGADTVIVPDKDRKWRDERRALWADAIRRSRA